MLCPSPPTTAARDGSSRSADRGRTGTPTNMQQALHFRTSTQGYANSLFSTSRDKSPRWARCPKDPVCSRLSPCGTGVGEAGGTAGLWTSQQLGWEAHAVPSSPAWVDSSCRNPQRALGMSPPTGQKAAFPPAVCHIMLPGVFCGAHLCQCVPGRACHHCMATASPQQAILHSADLLPSLASAPCGSSPRCPILCPGTAG